MKILRISSGMPVAALGLCLALSPNLSASTLVHTFLFNNSLADSTGSATMSANGGSLTATNYVFGANQGLTLTGVSNSLSDYSIEMEFSLANVNGFNKILDFKNLTSDRGLYVAFGGLRFFDLATGGSIAANTPVRVVLTRTAATDELRVWVNGATAFSVGDPLGRGIFTGPLQFFGDDNGGSEASAGSVDLIRVYNGALMPAEVESLTSPGSSPEVPEPATLAITGLGLASLAILKRRQR